MKTDKPGTFTVVITCARAGLRTSTVVEAETEARAAEIAEGPVRAGGNVWSGNGARPDGLPTDAAEEILLEEDGYEVEVRRAPPA